MQTKETLVEEGRSTFAKFLYTYFLSNDPEPTIINDDPTKKHDKKDIIVPIQSHPKRFGFYTTSLPTKELVLLSKTKTWFSLEPAGLPSITDLPFEMISLGFDVHSLIQNYLWEHTTYRLVIRQYRESSTKPQTKLTKLTKLPFIDAGYQLLDDLGVAHVKERALVEFVLVSDNEKDEKDKNDTKPWIVIPKRNPWVSSDSWPPFDALERVAYKTQNKQNKQNQKTRSDRLWRVQPAMDYTDPTIVSVPTLLFLRDWFEECGIPTFMDAYIAENLSGWPTTYKDLPREENSNNLSFHWLTKQAHTDAFRTCRDRRRTPKEIIRDSPLRLELECNLLLETTIKNNDDALRLANRFAVLYSGCRPFEVKTNQWSSYDGFSCHNQYDDEESRVSLVSEFSGWCNQSRQSLMGQLRSSAAAEGGFLMPRCPGSDILHGFALCNEFRHDCRGTTQYDGRSNVPAWAMVALRESMDAYGLHTTHSTYDSSTFWSPTMCIASFSREPTPILNGSVSLKTFAMKNGKAVAACELYFGTHIAWSMFLCRSGYDGVVGYSLSDAKLINDGLLIPETNFASKLTLVRQQNDYGEQPKYRYDPYAVYGCLVQTTSIASIESKEKLVQILDRHVRCAEQQHLRLRTVGELCKYQNHWDETPPRFQDLIGKQKFSNELNDEDRKWLFDNGIGLLMRSYDEKESSYGSDANKPKNILLVGTYVHEAVNVLNNDDNHNLGIIASTLAARKRLLGLIEDKNTNNNETDIKATNTATTPATDTAINTATNTVTTLKATTTAATTTNAPQNTLRRSTRKRKLNALNKSNLPNTSDDKKQKKENLSSVKTVGVLESLDSKSIKSTQPTQHMEKMTGLRRIIRECALNVIPLVLTPTKSISTSAQRQLFSSGILAVQGNSLRLNQLVNICSSLPSNILK